MPLNAENSLLALPPEPEQTEYAAFISYNHEDDYWAAWLQNALETYRVPWRLQRRGGRGHPARRRLSPVYRDLTEEATSFDLDAAIRANLRRSHFLIVICSPRSAKSRRVNEEIDYFKGLGRASRVLCLIVGGEPNAADSSKECFPLAVRTLSIGAADPAAKTEAARKIEPIAADVRGGSGSRRIAFVKIVAGILGVKFDTLWRRERRRLMRRMLRYGVATIAALIATIATYVSVADQGLAVPGEALIRLYLDRYDASVFRRAHSLAAILDSAETGRKGIIERLGREWTNKKWIYTTPDRLTAPKTAISPWVSSQAACAALRAIEPTQKALSDFRDMLYEPFANGFPTKLGWLVSDADYPQVHPTLWTIAALAVALQRVDLFKREEIDHFLSRLEIAQTVADLYYPLRDGGWNVLPQQADQAAHATSATALAFMSLLELHKADVGWHGDRARLNTMLAATAKWLDERFDITADPPGWRIHLNDVSATDNGEVADGLTLQIYSEFLRAEDEVGMAVPAAILRSIPYHIDRLVGLPLNYANIRASTFRYFTNEKGVSTSADVPETYLWYPWAIEASARWLHRLERTDAPTEDKVRARRALGYLVVDLGREYFPMAAIGYSPTFVASETLYALATVHLLHTNPDTVPSR